MSFDLEQQRYQSRRMATAPETSNQRRHSALFRHPTDPIDTIRLGHEWIENNSLGKAHADPISDMNGTSRPHSGVVSPVRHSFDSDLRNHYRQSRRYSLPYDAGESAGRAHSGAPLFDFAQGRYRGTLLPIPPPSKEKEILRSLTKLISGSWNRKPTISEAKNPQHLQHVGFDPNTGHYLGLPKEWERILSSSSGHQWNALMSVPISSDKPSPSSLPGGNQSNEQAEEDRRLTLSSVTDSFYSDNSRYRVPAERPPSFPSTAASINEDFGPEPDIVRPVPTTRRPLPYNPL